MAPRRMCAIADAAKTNFTSPLIAQLQNLACVTFFEPANNNVFVTISCALCDNSLHERDFDGYVHLSKKRIMENKTGKPITGIEEGGAGVGPTKCDADYFVGSDC